jgi:uncharacterized membrane protein
MTLIKNWAVAFVSLFILSFVWHNLILVDFYTENLSAIGRYTDGAVAPLLPFLALGILIAALNFAVFVPAVSKDAMSFAKNGLVAGLASAGVFAFLSYAIFTGWSTNLMWADFAYSLISGVLTGLLLMVVNKHNN